MKKTLQFLMALSVAISLLVPGGGIVTEPGDDPHGGNVVNMIIEPDV